MTRYARRQLVAFDAVGEVFGLVMHDEGEDGARLANFVRRLQSLRRRFVLPKSSESVLGAKLLPHIQAPGRV